MSPPTARIQVSALRTSSDSEVRLFCVPHAGGGIGGYRSWPEAFPLKIAVYALGLPGREDRFSEQPFILISPLVAAATKALAPYLDRPLALFGHSMGALIAFEVARELRRVHALAPTHLFVSGFRAPHLPDPRPATYDLPAPELFAEIRRLNGMPDEILHNEELLHLLLPTLRADFRVVQTYAHACEPPLDCPITVYGGMSDPDIKTEQLVAWQMHTSSRFAVKLFPGDHFFLHASEDLLLRDIYARLVTL